MKRLLTILLTVILILSLSTAAFAAETKYSDQSTVTITKVYKLIGTGESPAETFTLEQVSSDVLSGEATTAPALVSIAGVAFIKGAATAAGAEGEITITLPTYTRVGVYQYDLREVAGTTAGVTYHSNLIRLVVSVINDEESGKLRVAGVHTEDLEDTTTTAKSDTFVNTYSAGTLDISKEVTGNLGDKDKYFEFTVTLTGEDGKDYEASYAVAGGTKIENGTDDCAASTIEIGVAKKFYLKHGETISIANLPYGVTYAVTETECVDYETTYTGEEGTIDDAAQTAAFVNDKDSEIDTGVILDNLPYVMILGLVVLATAALMLKRRKVEE